jgi:O-antigen/teichoic acid export membrane protein
MVSSRNPKLIVKNTIFLYIRMFLSMGIGFFMSRVLLKELGVSDFGIYNLVGGVVAMFASLRGLFASSTQRFLNVAMGKGDREELKKIFSTSITIHLLICVVFFLLVETVGLWFVNNKLIIELDRMEAAMWVFQFSMLTAIVTLLTIPYDAIIIAYERMNVYAYISILDISLKLAVIGILSWSDFDKLKLYAVLVFMVSIIIRMMSWIYCRRHFEEAKYTFIWDLKLFKQMGSFAGWNFFGNMAFSLTHEGVNVLLNIFGGTPINAARGIAYQVRSAMMQLTSNAMMAGSPQIMKLYSEGRKHECLNISYFISKVSFFVLLTMSLPMFLYADNLLRVWLGNVPPYASFFVILIVTYMLVRVFHAPLDNLFMAAGRLKIYQILDSSTSILCLPISYLCLSQGFPLKSVFIVMIMIEILKFTVLLLLAGKIIGINLGEYSKKVLYPCFIVLMTSGCASMVLKKLVDQPSVFRLILLIISCPVFVISSAWCMGLTKNEQKQTLALISKSKKI